MKEKEKMMKKLLIFMLVLGIASVSQAVWTGFVVDGYGSEYDGPLGVSIRIDLIADTDWSATVWGGIVEASAVNSDGQADADDVVDMGGAVSTDAVYANAGNVSIGEAGWVDNWVGNLICTVAASSTGAVSAGVATVSFDYLLPSTASSDWYVAPLIDAELYYYDGGSFAIESTYSDILGASEVLIEGLHIIPEPMTVLLLGLGGLFLRRRR